jgi:hypothetical protein
MTNRSSEQIQSRTGSLLEHSSSLFARRRIADRCFFLAAAVAPSLEINIKRIETSIKRSEE